MKIPLALMTACLLPLTIHAENWPMWRGSRLDGSSLDSVPTAWSATENIQWRTEIPASGHASPIVWGDRVFVVGADEDGQERLLIALNRADGKILWKTPVLRTQPERIHRLNSLASSTPATDGERVFSTFLDGDQVVVAAHDFNGKELWLKRPGRFASVHGFCSSPILFEDKVIVNCDHDGDGYIVALARDDGREMWRIDRPNKTRSYCAPLIREMAGKIQMVLSGSKCVASYDPKTGALIWIMDGPTEQFVASPVYNERTGLLYITGGYPQRHILAIRPDGSGDVTKTHIAWRTKQGAAYVPSPITAGDYFLLISDSGVAHCFDAASGRILWQQRMGEHHSSPVLAGGLVYFLNDDGVTHVVRPGPNYELVARNDLGEKTFASPAVSEGQIFIRGEKSLFCIGKRTATSAKR